MNNINRRLNEIRQKGYTLDVGDLINQSFENYKKIALLAGLALMIVILILILGTVFTINYYFGFEDFGKQMENLNPANFTSMQLLAYIACISLLAILFAPFTGGLIKIAHDVETKDEVSFSNIFDCYTQPYLKDLILSSLIITLVTTAITIPFQIIHLDFIGSLLSYVVGLMTCMTIPLIVFGNLTAFEAIKNSIMLVSKQPLMIFLALLIAVIGSCVGLLAFCLGIFFTLPYLYSMYYTIYKNSVGFDQKSEIDEIGSVTE